MPLPTLLLPLLPSLQVLAAGRLGSVLRDGTTVLRSAADDRAVAGRCARLLARLLALGRQHLPTWSAPGTELAGAGVALLQRGWDGSGWEGGSEAAAGGAALLAGVVGAADDDELSRQAGEATAPLCSLLAAEVGDGGSLSANGHTALALLHRIVVRAASEAAVEQAAGAGAAAALLRLLPEEPEQEGRAAAAGDQALALLGALADRESGAWAILSTPGGLERLAICVHDSASAKVAAGVLAALASRFPAELAQVGRPPVRPAPLHHLVGPPQRPCERAPITDRSPFLMLLLPCWPSPVPVGRAAPGVCVCVLVCACSL
jgi:hypothetical protein